MAPTEFKIIENPDTNELLRYHLAVTEKADRETERKAHVKALAALDKAAIQPVHPHAEISFTAQQIPENPNNVKAAESHNRTKAEMAADDKKFKQIPANKEEELRGAMAAQVTAAAARKDDSPASVGNGGGEVPAVQTPAPVKKSGIPEWPSR